MKKNKSYRPLPEGLSIEDSTIEGKGLFTNVEIPQDHNLGVSHVRPQMYDMESELIRTPLGGFINHSDNPNCYISDKFVMTHSLLTLRDIQPGEELTVDYNTTQCGKTYVENFCSKEN